MKGSLLFLQRTQIQLPVPTWRHATIFTFSSRGSQHYVHGLMYACSTHTNTQTYTLIKKKNLEVNTGQQDSSVSKGACCNQWPTFNFPRSHIKAWKTQLQRVVLYLYMYPRPKGIYIHIRHTQIFSFYVFFFETEYHYLTQAGLELTKSDSWELELKVCTTISSRLIIKF